MAAVAEMFFPVSRAAQLAKVDERVVRRWVSSGLLRPEHADVGLMTFRDVVALRTLALLHFTHKVKMRGPRGLAKFARWLLAQQPDAWSRLRFYVAGAEVLYESPDGALQTNFPAGQTTSRTVQALDMKRVSADTRRDIERMARRKHGRIDETRRVIEGTRIETSQIHALHVAGLSVPRIVREFPSLNTADVIAALEFEDGHRAA